MAENSNVSPAALSAMQAVSDSMILARTARKKTQAEVASACSMSLGTYQAVERGALTPTLQSYVKVLEYYGLVETLGFVGASIFDKEGQALRKSK